MPDTLTVTCADCRHENTISAPDDDAWEPLHEVVGTGPGRRNVVVGYRIVVRCTECGARTQITQEDSE